MKTAMKKKSLLITLLKNALRLIRNRYFDRYRLRIKAAQLLRMRTTKELSSVQRSVMPRLVQE